MPTYEYRCAKCGQHFDVYQSFSEEPLTKHKGCGGKVSKVLGAAGIVLKGSGFYKTDNRSSSSKKSSEKKSTESTTSSATGADSTSNSNSSNSSNSDSSSKSSSGSGSSSSEAKSA